MVKSAKTVDSKVTPRSVKSGQFLGRTREGLVVAKPIQKPKNFSVSELGRVIRDVRRGEAARKAG